MLAANVGARRQMLVADIRSCPKRCCRRPSDSDPRTPGRRRRGDGRDRRRAVRGQAARHGRRLESRRALQRRHAPGPSWRRRRRAACWPKCSTPTNRPAWSSKDEKDLRPFKRAVDHGQRACAHRPIGREESRRRLEHAHRIDEEAAAETIATAKFGSMPRPLHQLKPANSRPCAALAVCANISRARLSVAQPVSAALAADSHDALSISRPASIAVTLCRSRPQCDLPSGDRRVQSRPGNAFACGMNDSLETLTVG